MTSEKDMNVMRGIASGYFEAYGDSQPPEEWLLYVRMRYFLESTDLQRADEMQSVLQTLMNRFQ